jgi:O-succinylbenzoate synthase
VGHRPDRRARLVPELGPPRAPADLRGPPLRARRLSPGELAIRLSALAVVVDDLHVERGAVPVAGYYESERPSGIAVLRGAALAGYGECVAWTPAEQAEFAAACDRLTLPYHSTIGALSALLTEELADPYHRAAVEGAVIDLALRQAGTNPFALTGLPPLPVSFCRSIGREDDPLAAIGSARSRDPQARIKIDVPLEGWPAPTWEELSALRRIVVLDFKRESDIDQVRLAHAAVPNAWLEDPPAEAITLDPRGGWTARVALDGYVLAAVDLDDPEIPPAAVNVKAPRVGGWLEALRCLEECRRRGLHAYVGGMFEVGPGRLQARVLASLFTAAAWNDVAPISRAGDMERSSPLEQTDRYAGFAPGP